jgi:hypothetical protein
VQPIPSPAHTTSCHTVVNCRGSSGQRPWISPVSEVSYSYPQALPSLAAAAAASYTHALKTSRLPYPPLLQCAHDPPISATDPRVPHLPYPLTLSNQGTQRIDSLHWLRLPIACVFFIHLVLGTHIPAVVEPHLSPIPRRGRPSRGSWNAQEGPARGGMGMGRKTVRGSSRCRRPEQGRHFFRDAFGGLKMMGRRDAGTLVQRNKTMVQPRQGMTLHRATPRAAAGRAVSSLGADWEREGCSPRVPQSAPPLFWSSSSPAPTSAPCAQLGPAAPVETAEFHVEGRSQSGPSSSFGHPFRLPATNTGPTLPHGFIVSAAGAPDSILSASTSISDEVKEGAP